jgi:hypothetical protein
MGLLRAARVAGWIGGTAAGTVLGTALLLELGGRAGFATVALGAFWGAVVGAKFVGTKPVPGVMGGAGGGLAMAATVHVLTLLLGSGGRTAFSLGWLAMGVSVTKLVVGWVVVSVVVPMLPGTEW